LAYIKGQVRLIKNEYRLQTNHAGQILPDIVGSDHRRWT